MKNGQRSDGLLVTVEINDSYDAKAAAAYELRQQGLAWPEISERSGFDTGEEARAAVNRLLKLGALQATREFREQALVMDLERLDRLLAAVWPLAMTADTKAIAEARAIIATRSKFLGYETLYDQNASETGKTVVIVGNSEQYVNDLKAVVEADSG